MIENIFLFIILAAIAIYGVYEFRCGPSPYRGRNCTGRAWKKAFPHSPKENIREFLGCLVNGMAISSKTKLKFHPNDQVMDIYRSFYGGRTPAGNNMELETFVENLSETYSFIFLEIIETDHGFHYRISNV